MFVHKFNRETNLTERLSAPLPGSVVNAGGVSVNGTIFIFNGRESNVLEFNEKSETAEVIGELPFMNGTSWIHSVRAISTGQDGVWLFAGNAPKATNPVLLFNTASKLVSIPTISPTLIPHLFEAPASVSDGSQGYLIGGIGRLDESDGSYHPNNGILR
jgi:hypothetical protein